MTALAIVLSALALVLAVLAVRWHVKAMRLWRQAEADWIDAAEHYRRVLDARDQPRRQQEGSELVLNVSGTSDEVVSEIERQTRHGQMRRPKA